MTRKRLRIILAFVGATVVLAFGLLSDLDGGLGKLKKMANWLEAALGWPIDKPGVTNTLILLIFAVVFLALLLIKKLFPEKEVTDRVIDDSKAREGYLQWIRNGTINRLKSAVHFAHYMDLALWNSPEMIAPLNYVYHDLQQGVKRKIDSLDELFTNRHFRILLLGSPGAGKTTTMLHYLKRFTEEAEKAPDYDIPLFVNLSKWRKRERVMFRWFGDKKESKQPDDLAELDFSEWLIGECVKREGGKLRRAVIENWIQRQRICLFLDGLDEAEEGFRKVIVRKLNTFLELNTSMSVIVCSRLADYEALVNTTGLQLSLTNGVTIQPLTPEQIEDYLKAADTPQLQVFLDKDEGLREMAKNPLDLSVMVLAYKYSPERLVLTKTHSITAKRMALFEAYVRAMVERELLRRRSDPMHPASEVMRSKVHIEEKMLSGIYRYLSFIARLMSQQSRSSFSPGKLFEYYSSDENDQPQGYREIATGLLLSVGLISLSWAWKGVYPATWLILGPLVAIGSFGFFIFGLTKNDDFKDKRRNFFALVGGWPMIMVLFSPLNLGFSYLFSIWTYSIWIFITIAGIIYLLLSYDLIGEYDPTSMFEEIVDAPVGAHLINATALLLPFVFIWFFHGLAHPEWIFLYFLTIASDAGAINSYVGGGKRFAKDLLVVISVTLYALSASVAAIPVFQDQARMIMLLFFVLIMLFGMSYLLGDREYNGVGMFISGWLAALSGVWLGPGAVFIVGIALVTILTLKGERVYRVGMVFLGSRIILLLLKLSGMLPVRFNKFLRYAMAVRLLKENSGEYDFIHRRIRDYFAIQRLVLSLEKAVAAERLTIVRKMCALKDASCDVLLEMVDDHEKGIRMECIQGLGRIGSETTARALIELSRRTSGELRQQAVRNLHKVKDMGAIPLLIGILNDQPFNSDLFEAAFLCLDNLDQLQAWDNPRKMEEALAVVKPDMQKIIQLALIRRQRDTIAKVESMARMLSMAKRTDIRQENEIDAILDSISQDELVSLLQSATEDWTDAIVKRIKTVNLAPAIPKMLETLKRGSFYKLSRYNIRRIFPLLEKIVLEGDTGYTGPAVNVLFPWRPRRTEKLCLKLADRVGKPSRDIFLKELAFWGTHRCLPIFIRCLHEGDEQNVASAVRYFSGFSSMALIGEYISFVQNRQESSHCADVVSLLGTVASPEAIDFLIKLLDSNKQEIKIQAILALGRLKAKCAIPQLWDLFRRQEVVYLPALIRALGELEEDRIIASLPLFFDTYPDIGGSVLDVLKHFGAVAEKQLGEVCLLFDRDRTRYGEKVHQFFALYFAERGDFQRMIELLFPDNLAPLMLPPQPEPAMLWKLLKIRMLDGLDFDENASGKNGHVYDTLSAGKRLRSEVFRWLNCDDDGIGLLEMIYAFDDQLVKEMAGAFFTDERRDIRKVLVSTLSSSSISQEQRWLLAGLCLPYNITIAIPFLRGCIGSEDVVLACIAIESLGEFEDYDSREAMIASLHSSKQIIVESAINAIKNLCDERSITIEGMGNLFRNNPVFRSVLARIDTICIMKQLESEQYQVLAADANPDVRYLAAVYAGLIGFGNAIGWLSELLADHHRISLENERSHVEVADGARFALLQIGTPSATSLLENGSQPSAIASTS